MVCYLLKDLVKLSRATLHNREINYKMALIKFGAVFYAILGQKKLNPPRGI
jgi:hypothetical protein